VSETALAENVARIIPDLLRAAGRPVHNVPAPNGGTYSDRWAMTCPECGLGAAYATPGDNGQVYVYCERCLLTRRSSGGYYHYPIGAFVEGLQATKAPTGLPVLEREARVKSFADLAGILKGTEWCWPGWLPAGMLTLVAAGLEMGKSLLALRIAATFLRANAWPDGAPYIGETGAVVWCETESSQALNLTRAQAWGLPVDRILLPELPGDELDFSLDAPEHRAALEATAQQDDVRLVVVDSFSGGSGRRENEARAGEVTGWLAGLARDSGKPVFLSHHLRKRGVYDPDPRREVTLDLLRGSSAIPQTPRLVWALDQPDPQSQTRRLSCIKSNLGPKPEPLGMSIDDTTWPLFGGCPSAPHIATAEDRAAEFLLDALNKEPLPAIAIFRDTDGMGLSTKTVKRAKAKLGIVSVKLADGWYWSLPAPGGIE
jgi:putative DNA primase/helicase